MSRPVLAIEKHALRTRYDKKPLTMVDWASVISVSSIYRMQRILEHACKALYQHGISAGIGFERDTYGMYFLIREKGSRNYLGTYYCGKVEGVQLRLWPREEKCVETKESQVRFM